MSGNSPTAPVGDADFSDSSSEHEEHSPQHPRVNQNLTSSEGRHRSRIDGYNHSSPETSGGRDIQLTGSGGNGNLQHRAPQVDRQVHGARDRLIFSGTPASVSQVNGSHSSIPNLDPNHSSTSSPDGTLFEDSSEESSEEPLESRLSTMSRPRNTIFPIIASQSVSQAQTSTSAGSSRVTAIDDSPQSDISSETRLSPRFYNFQRNDTRLEPQQQALGADDGRLSPRNEDDSAPGINSGDSCGTSSGQSSS